MLTRTYTLKVVLEAEDESEFPEAQDLATGIAEGLPEAWFSMDEGDQFAIQSIHWDQQQVVSKCLAERECQEPISEINQRQDGDFDYICAAGHVSVEPF